MRSWPVIASKSGVFHCLDSTYLIVFCGFLLRSSELVFRRLCRSRHRGLEVEMSLEEEARNLMEGLTKKIADLFNAE